MKSMTVIEKVKSFLETKVQALEARIIVTREDGITIFDSTQNQTTTSVAALVSGVWQASEALMSLVHPVENVLEFRLGFDTSSQGIYLFSFNLNEKRYFLGAVYNDCLNPAYLKRQIVVMKDEMEKYFASFPVQQKVINTSREGYLFKDITDAEIDRLFALGGI